MNEQNIYEAYQCIVSLLEEQRLKEAHRQLQSLLDTCADYNLQNRLEQTATAYQFMLKYLQQGSEDPDRHKLYLHFCGETWEIADQTCLLLLDSVSPDYYHSLRRTRQRMPSTQSLTERLHVLEAFNDDMSLCQLMPQDRQMLDNALARHENTNKQLFLDTWINSQWTAGEAQEADAFLHSEQLTTTDLCLFVSAVTLSLQACFDARKLKWLLDACHAADVHPSQRALVGVALTLHRYPNRLPFYPALTAQLMLMDEDGRLSRRLNNIYIQLLRSQETENINRKMREEIIPEMMKNVERMRNLKFGFEESGEENDLNPDWEKMFAQPELSDKLREMGDLQMEGSDIYMGAFAQLKRLPFFKDLPHWFYPFDRRHSAVMHIFDKQDATDGKTIADFLLQEGVLCDSDKYSMVFMLNGMPEAQRRMTFDQIAAQMPDEAMENLQNELQNKRDIQPDIVSNLYIHDLYRFFKLNPRRKEMHDIFQDEIALHSIPTLAPLLDKPELLKAVADFHFSKAHHADAIELYGQVIATGGADADIFQRMGYCYQKEKHYSEAIDAYQKADILKPDNVWNIRHLATCYRLTHDYETALEYYRKAATMQADNRNVLFYTGSCLAELERYEDALQYFFQLDLMENDGNVKTWRAIAWCSFVGGKNEQAEKYYEKILASPSPVAADYLNAGHVAWKEGNLELAVSRYGAAARKYEKQAIFLQQFNKDKEILARMGLRTEDIPLLADLAE